MYPLECQDRRFARLWRMNQDLCVNRFHLSPRCSCSEMDWAKECPMTRSRIVSRWEAQLVVQAVTAVVLPYHRPSVVPSKTWMTKVLCVSLSFNDSRMPYVIRQCARVTTDGYHRGSLPFGNHTLGRQILCSPAAILLIVALTTIQAAPCKHRSMKRVTKIQIGRK